jgi:hypothetical protein
MCDHIGKIIEFQYEKICSYCGLVMDQNYIETAGSYNDVQRSSVINDFYSSTRIAVPESVEKTKTTKHRYTSARIADVQDIKDICARYQITSSAQSSIIEVWKVYHNSQKSRKGENRIGVLMNCFFRGLAQNGDLRTKEEICQFFNSTPMIFKKGEKLLSPLLPNSEMKNEDIFYNRFVRMVREENLPFHLATTMNDLYNKNYKILQTFSNHSTINTIFIYVVENYKLQIEEASLTFEMARINKKKTNMQLKKRRKNNFKTLCMDKGLSLPAFTKIKNTLH